MNPYGECHHTHYKGGPPCIHSAYDEGYETGYEIGEIDGRVAAWNGEWSYRRLMDETRERAIKDCINNLTTYIDEFHKHVGDYSCQPTAGDTCDMSATVRVAVNRLKAML